MTITFNSKNYYYWLLVFIPFFILSYQPILGYSSESIFTKDLYGFFQCQFCQTPELTGDVDDSYCNYETVNKAVDIHFHPILQKLVRVPFFKYFKVNMGKECPYWDNDDGVCMSRECSVCECDENEIPKTWYNSDRANKEKLSYHSEACDEQQGTDALSRVNLKNAEVGKNFQSWDTQETGKVWSNENDYEEMIYVNLIDNPERYTGYSGPPAQRIWNALYKENCFLPPPGNSADLGGMCLEERIYYRLISGLQASINTHIALEYKFGDDIWGVNTKLFVERVGKYPEYLKNLYFTYLFVMRAISRGQSILKNYDYNTGNDVEDKNTRELIAKLTEIDPLNSKCPSESLAVLKGFDESVLFRVDTTGLNEEQAKAAIQQKELLEIQFREKFQNISRIMDCVSCEKCRLWGKVQVMGIGTAVKILLAENIEDIGPLQRNEIIALINVLNRLSESVDGVKVFRQLEFEHSISHLLLLLLIAVCIVLCIVFWKRLREKPSINKMN